MKTSDARDVSGACAASSRSAVLRAIRKPGVDLAVWQRSLFPCLARYLRGVRLDERFNRRFVVAPADLRKDTDAGLRGLGVPLIADVCDLVGKFAQFHASTRISVRLECVTDNACCKFHADFVGLRLITTYVGPGTEWIYGPHGADRLRQLGGGDVGLFKGRNWQEGYTPNILHRSPPIARKRTARLLLVVDDLVLDDH